MANEITIRIPKPYAKQQLLIDNRKRNNLLLLPRRYGKSTVAEHLVAVDAIKTPNYRVAWAAPTWKLMLETFERFVQTLHPITKRLSRDERRIVLINGSVLEFWSSNDPSAMRGRRYHRIVVDEVQRQRNLNEFVKGSARPCLADFQGELWLLGTPNGEGTPFHDYYLEVKDRDNWQVAQGSLDDNPYIATEEIAQMREDLGPLMAAQEIDAQWVPINGLTPLISAFEWKSLVNTPLITRPQKVLALDASISGDTTGLIAAWRDLTTRQYCVDYDDIHEITPTLEDPETGILQIDFVALEAMIWRMWQTGLYAALVYDPYQCVSLAQRLRRKGVRTIEFTQNSMRVKADSYLKQVLSDGLLSHPDHPDLNHHIKNATVKYATNNSGLRIIKQDKSKKIDLAVALSMAVYAMTTLKPGVVEKYTPGVGSYTPVDSGNGYPSPTRLGNTPFEFLRNMNPFKK